MIRIRRWITSQLMLFGANPCVIMRVASGVNVAAMLGLLVFTRDLSWVLFLSMWVIAFGPARRRSAQWRVIPRRANWVTATTLTLEGCAFALEMASFFLGIDLLEGVLRAVVPLAATVTIFLALEQEVLPTPKAKKEKVRAQFRLRPAMGGRT